MAFRKAHGNDPQRIFRWIYILSAIFGLFSIFGSLWLVYYEKEMNIAKWKGTFLGILHSLVPMAVFVAIAGLTEIHDEQTLLGLLVVGVYILHYISIYVIARRTKSK